VFLTALAISSSPHASAKTGRHYPKSNARNVSQIAIVDKISGYATVSNQVPDLLNPHFFVRPHDRFRSIEV
jgi:hypothetical protein